MQHSIDPRLRDCLPRLVQHFARIESHVRRPVDGEIYCLGLLSCIWGCPFLRTPQGNRDLLKYAEQPGSICSGPHRRNACSKERSYYESGARLLALHPHGRFRKFRSTQSILRRKADSRTDHISVVVYFPAYLKLFDVATGKRVAVLALTCLSPTCYIERSQSLPGFRGLMHRILPWETG